MTTFFGCSEKDVLSTYLMFLVVEDPRKIYAAASKASKEHRKKGNWKAFTHAEIIRAYLASHPLGIKKSAEILDGIDPEILEAVLKEGRFPRTLVEDTVCRIDRKIDAKEMPVIKKMFPEQYFCICLFSGLLEEAESMLPMVKPESKLALWLVQSPTENWEKIKDLLNQNGALVGGSLLLLLLQKGVTADKIRPYIRFIQRITLHSIVLMKHLIVTGEDVSEYLSNPIIGILRVLDDWQIYEYALKTGVDMVPEWNTSIPDSEKKEKSHFISLNGLRYLMEKDPTPENIKAFVNCRLTFEAARTHLLGLTESGLDEVLRGKPTGFRMWVEHEISGKPLGIPDLKHFVGRESDVLLFIGALLSNREFSSVLSALIVAGVLQDSFSGCVMVRLVFLFISRYFMIYSTTVETYRKLNLQSVQLEGLTYSWHDLSLFFRRPEPDLEQQYVGARADILGGAKVGAKTAISSDNYMQLLSLFELYKCVSESPISKQIEKGKHQRSGTSNEILETLPESARYIFSKVEDPERPFLVQTLSDSCITGHSLEEQVTVTLTEVEKAVEILPEKREWVVSTLIPELLHASQFWVPGQAHND